MLVLGKNILFPHSKQTILLDLDDTFVDTEKYIRRVLKDELLEVKFPSVYPLRFMDGYAEIMEEIFQNYEVIPKTDGAEDCLNILKDEYEVVFCSCYVTEGEKKAKKSFADSYETEILLVGNGDYSKSSIDKTNCILVDDSLEVLSASNAAKNIQVFNKYAAKGLTYAEYLLGDYLAENLSSVVTYLMGGIQDAKSEEFGRSICQRVQGKC